MERWYKKNKGNAGLLGVQFQVNLLTVCLLNALKHRKKWTISTENSEVEKFDDIVVELPGTTAILVQAKHKENRKITKDQLFADNSKNADFSLAKYFFSYEEIKKKFKKKVVIICTDTSLDKKGLEGVLTLHNADADSMLHCGDEGCSFYTFNDDIVPDLKASSIEYLNKNLKGKNIDRGIITDENVKDFLSNLQVFTDYPSESEMHAIISQLLSGLHESSLWHRTSSHDVYKKVEDWFVQPKGEYLTEFRAKAFFCEIKSDKYVEALKDLRMSFERNHFEFGESKRIFHVTAEGVHLLQVLKVYHALQDKKKKLYANPEDDVEVHKHVIEAFGLPRYVYLIMVWGKITQGTLIKEMGDKLRDILEESPYKKLILVADGSSVLPQQVGLKDVSQVDGSVIFKDLSKESQRKLLKLKNIDFQGKLVSLEDLLAGQTVKDYTECLDARILDELVKGTSVKVGARPLALHQDVSGYYVSRRFERNENENENRRCDFAEDGIFDVKEKVVLISDGAGTGKTTVLIKLAVDLKEKRPHLWIVRVNLNEYTRVLKSKKTIDVIELLDSKEGTKLTTRLEKFIFTLKEKVVIMLDGVDEISPDYTSLILNLIGQCQKAPNFAKILITTRPHMTPQLEAALNVGSYRLLPFTNYDQIEFLTKYWTYNLQLGDHKNNTKVERYAKTLVCQEYYSATGLDWEGNFAAIPLLLKSLADVFHENVTEFMAGGSVNLNLPEKFISRLYDTFIENKRDIFIEKGNPSGNVRANKALNNQFEECLDCHRDLALQKVLNPTERALFSKLPRNTKVIAEHVMILGVAEEFSEDVNFKHETFADYFFAEVILRELRVPNTNVHFQEFFIEEILQKFAYKLVRVFLNNLLEKGDSLPSNIFASYHSTSNAWKSKENLIFTLSNEGCEAVLRLVLRRIKFQTVNEVDIETDSKDNINFKNEVGDIPLHVAIKTDNLEGAKRLIEQGADLLARDCTGREALHLAAEKDQLDTVKLILQRGININNREMCGRTAIHLAVLNEQWKTTEYLLERGADSNIIGKDGHTALHLIAKTSSPNIMKLFLDSGIDVNVKDNRNRTALYVATRSWQLETVKLLVEHKAHVNIPDSDGRTALHIAVKDHNESMIKYLMQCGANVNAKDDRGFTPIHLTSSLKDTMAIPKCILDNGANINERTNNGYTILHLAVMDDRLDIVKECVAHEADVTIRDNNGHTALHLALLNCYGERKINIIKYLVSLSRGINIADNLGRTELHAAARNGNINIIEDLVKKGWNIHAVDNDGRTALHFAAEGDSAEAVRYFVERGIDVNVADRKGCTSFHIASERSSDDTLKLLVKHGAEIHLRTCDGRSALHFAAKGFYTDNVVHLVEHGLDVNITDSDGYTALHTAAERNNGDTVKFLVEHGANIELKTCDGHSTLHYAAKGYRIDSVACLVERGLDVNIRNSDGRTALHVAAEQGNEDVVKYLAEHGAHVNLIDIGGHTALCLAVENDMIDAVRCLVDRGADPDITSADGRTPLHIAVDNKNVSMITYLTDHGADVNLRNSDGLGALHLIAKRNITDAIRSLAAKGVDFNVRSADGRTPLHLAIATATRHTSTIELLVDLKVDVDARDDNGNAALHLVIERELEKYFKYLLKHGANINIKNNAGHTPLHLAAWFDCKDFVMDLVKHSANINDRDCDGRTALHFAAELGMSHTVKYLMKCGADGSIGDSDGRTAIHSAAQFGCLESIKCLVEHGADINMTDNNSSTALHLAVRNRKTETVKLLLELGADFNTADNDGCTALDLSARHGSMATFNLHLRHITS